MTNDELEKRMKLLIEEIPKHARQLGLSDKNMPPVQKIGGELELLNACMVGIIGLMTEIAKRLPEPKGE